MMQTLSIAPHTHARGPLVLLSGGERRAALGPGENAGTGLAPQPRVSQSPLHHRVVMKAPQSQPAGSSSDI